MVNGNKNYSCCVIGHRKVSENIKIVQELINLIEQQNIAVFKFGYYGEFNELCYKTLIELKKKYSNIKLILYSLNNEVAFTFEEAERYKYKYKNKEFPYKSFDEIIYLTEVDETRFKYACVLRNKKLIDESDICLFYLRENYTLLSNGHSGTKIAYDYAKKGGKNIIII